MTLYITQKSYFFVIKNFINFFLGPNSEVIYVSEKKRGIFKKYLEIIINFGIANTVIIGLSEIYYFFRLYFQERLINSTSASDYNLNEIIEQKLNNKKFKKIISIGCPCKINKQLEETYNLEIKSTRGDNSIPKR